jgi:hypothetical protein
MSLKSLLKQKYRIESCCVEIATYEFDDNNAYFRRINGYGTMLVTPDLKYGKYLSEFKVKSVSELLIKLELEGFLAN